MKDLIRKIFNKVDSNYKYKKISYSQYGEDLLIKSIFREYLGIEQPSYLDIGAHHPFHLSNTALFYKFGSRGTNIEANPDLINAFKKFRPEDTNLNIGISPANTNDANFYIMEQPELNTFIKSQADDLALKGYPIKKVIKISCFSLEHVIKTHCNNKFPDFLSLDVEGFDEMILKSYDFSLSRPKIICVENLYKDKECFFSKNKNIRSILEANNYFLIGDTFLNDIYADTKEIKYR